MTLTMNECDWKVAEQNQRGEPWKEFNGGLLSMDNVTMNKKGYND